MKLSAQTLLGWAILPGDVIELQAWREGADIRFRCVVPERGVTVIDNGLARVA